MAEPEPNPRKRALEQAIRFDDREAVEALVDQHPELMQTPIHHRRWSLPLVHAADLGKLTIVKALLHRDPSAVEQAFGRACLQGHSELARFLLSTHPELGENLHYALFGPCEALKARAIPFLIELGADPNAVWEDGSTPLDMAICTYSHQGRPACIEALVQGGAVYEYGPEMDIHRNRLDLLGARLDADPELINRPSQFRAGKEYGGLYGGAPLIRPTLLHICAEFGALTAARMLIERGADPNARCLPDQSGIGNQTPIFHAATSNHNHAFPVLKILIENGADLNAPASLRVPSAGLQSVSPDDPVLKNTTPLGYALKYPNSLHHKPHQDAIDFLRQHGARE